MNHSPVLVQVLAFIATSSLAFLILMLLKRVDPRLRGRLDSLRGSGKSVSKHNRLSKTQSQSVVETAKSALSKIGLGLLPGSDSKRLHLQIQLVQAGIYDPSALSILTATKLILTILPPIVGFAVGSLGLIETQMGLLIGTGAGALGMLLPGLWLGWKKSKRQSTLRRSLPDFLDLLVTCLESGLSLEGSLQRVTDELQMAHPLLSSEMGVVQREIALGRATDEALRNFAERSDLDVVKTLATFVQQGRRFGTSMAESLRVHSEMLRTQREQRAEELAQKAAVKILFPTMFFILPVIFVVLVGPAALQIQQQFAQQNAETPHQESRQDALRLP